MQRGALLEVLGQRGGRRAAACEPQHTLAQPLQPEQQQGDADHDLQRLERDPREHHRADEESRESEQRDRSSRADERVATTALGGDGEHDRQRFEQLERDRQRRAGERQHERGQSCFSPQNAAYGLAL